jgi:hypothetical protein
MRTVALTLGAISVAAWVPCGWYQLRFRYRRRGGQPLKYRLVLEVLNSLVSYPAWAAGILLIWYHELAAVSVLVAAQIGLSIVVARLAYKRAIRDEERLMMSVVELPAEEPVRQQAIDGLRTAAQTAVRDRAAAGA